MIKDFTPEHIGIFRFSSLGDTVLAASVIKPLRERFPSTKITFVTGENYTPIFKYINELNDVIGIPLGGTLNDELLSFHCLWSADFDLIIDLHNKLRSKLLKHTLAPTHYITWDKAREARLSQIKFRKNYNPITVIPTYQRYLDTLKQFNIDASATFIPDNLLNVEPSDTLLTQYSLEPDNTISIAFGAKHYTKRWIFNYFKDLILLLSKANYRIVLLGSEIEFLDGEELRGNNDDVLNLCGEPLDIIEQICAASKLVISNDSGIAHLAEAVGTPVAMIFGSTSPVLGFGPRLVKSKAISLNLKCSPCHLHGRAECLLKHFDCMNNLKPDIVYRVITEMLKENSRGNI
jgi:heptosyltransferase II